jgi:hypothetical protein
MFVHDKEDQNFYDSFNRFIFSADKKVLGKLVSKIKFLEMTKDIPGDIVELGVFKGSGVLAWLKLNAINSVNYRKIYGFDMFDEVELLKTLSGSQKAYMESLFKDRSFSHVESKYSEMLDSHIQNIGFNNSILIKGNVFDTIPKFLDSNPGFRASIVNFDMDTDEPTYFALEKLWPRIVLGGVAIFDEYGVNEWDESNAVDRFIAKHGLNLIATNIPYPTAYIIKTHIS